MITAEGHKLARHWSRYSEDLLDSYLIQGVEHPSINPQSVLMRAFLVDRLFPGKFVEAIEEELVFSACACYALEAHRQGRVTLRELLNAVRSGDVDPRLPEFMGRRFQAERCHHLDIGQLITNLGTCTTLGFEYFHSPFQALWRQGLTGPRSARTSVLELGCGSANDYRFLEAYGVAQHVEYVGVDICEANIRNARSRFPNARFVTADACCLDEKDGSFDIVFAFDLLEHLSPDGLDAALAEAERVSRDEIWLSLFNADDIPEHDYHAVDDYFWNTLSLSQIAHHLNAGGYSTQVIPIAAELECRFPGYRHYNRGAHILIGTRESHGRPPLDDVALG
jgi:SAM-dependent methyltransferase